MWSLFAPLGKPSRFSSIICNYWKCTTYRQLSQSTGGKSGNRPWTEEDDRRLSSLVQQGFKQQRIAKEMSDHSVNAVEWRLILLRNDGKTLRVEREKATNYQWTAEEVALAREKIRQGLSLSKIASYFPDRGYNAARKYIQRLPSWPVSRRRAEQFTEEELQRIVEMRLKEGKTFLEMASEMECSVDLVETVWRFRCRNLVSKEVQESIQRRKLWTPSEEQHLRELQRRGTMNISDAALQFPSKSRGAIYKKILRMRLEFLKHHDRRNRVPRT